MTGAAFFTSLIEVKAAALGYPEIARKPKRIQFGNKSPSMLLILTESENVR